MPDKTKRPEKDCKCFENETAIGRNDSPQK
jgi:hypothetical protein